MGIKKGLTPRLAEVGKIKIGMKGEERKGKTKMYRLPVRLDHFIITTTERENKNGNFIPNWELMEKLDPKENWIDGQIHAKPKEIPIIFLFDDIDLNFQTSFAFYQGAKCLCRGDGETSERHCLKAGKQNVFAGTDNKNNPVFEMMDVKAGAMAKVECDPDICPFMQPNSDGITKCKPSGILSCLIPASMNIGGVYRFRSHSWNTLSNILASLELIKTITGGILVGLPMKLQMLKKATESHGNVNTVNVVFDGETHQEMRQLALIENKNRMEHGVNMLLIEDNARKAGFTNDIDDPADIEAEFYVESEEKKKPPVNITDRADLVLDGVQDESFVEPEEETELEPTIEEDEPEPEKSDKPETTEESNKKQPPDDGLEIF